MPGYMYYEDIKNSFPYTNTIDIVDLKGDVLLDVLEKSASFYNTEKPSGSFLQTSGNHVPNVVPNLLRSVIFLFKNGK